VPPVVSSTITLQELETYIVVEEISTKTLVPDDEQVATAQHEKKEECQDVALQESVDMVERGVSVVPTASLVVAVVALVVSVVGFVMEREFESRHWVCLKENVTELLIPSL